MTSLSTDVILLRGACAWIAGIVIIAAVSTYTVTPDRMNRPAPFWVIIPLLLGKIGLYLGPVAVSLATARSMRDFDRAWSLSAAVAVLLVCLWTSAIAVQLAQNLGYMAVGAKQRPIRFFDYEPKKKRRPKRAS